MPDKHISRIKVGSNSIGIIGLFHVIETIAKNFSKEDDDHIAARLLTALSQKNYIHSSSADKYKNAFLREYKKYLNLPFDEDVNDITEIRVLGQGCFQCDQLETDILALLSEMAVPADFDHVRDTMEIAGYGPVKLPALIINRKVVLSGRIVPKSKLKELLLENT